MQISSGPLLAVQNQQITRRDDLQEAQMVKIDLTQLEKVHTKASSKENQGISKVSLSETHAVGNREASTHND